MTPTQQKAMEMAIEALNSCRIMSVASTPAKEVTPKKITKAIEALRAALAEGNGKSCTETYSTTANFPHCPFCGSEPRYLGHKTGFYTERVICDPCGYHLPPETWNMRNGITSETSETKSQK